MCCVRKTGVHHIFHYFDDFIVVRAPDSQQCTRALEALNLTRVTLGVPIADHKREGPTTCLTFLSIEVDTRAGELQLSQDRLLHLRSLLVEWGDQWACEHWELESLIGIVNHTCRVIRSGQSFLRRMLDLLHGVPQHPTRPHPICLNRAFRSDPLWWRTFVANWNGVSFLPPPPCLLRLQMASDASGSWVCGAWHGCQWFRLQWDQRSAGLSIMAKELLPIVSASTVWGSKWNSHCVICHYDNQAVVASYAVPYKYTVAFIEARHRFSLAPKYSKPPGGRFIQELTLFISYQGSQGRRHGDPSPMAAVGAAPRLDPRLGLAWLAPAVQRYFLDGLAPTTRRSYDSAMRRFGGFCECFSIADPFPLNEPLRCSFTAFLADSALAPQ